MSAPVMYWFLSFSLFSAVCILQAQNFLTIDKASKTFQYGGQTVFLSGANQPWVNYGADFGNNQANGVFCQLNYTFANLSANAGNAVRDWLFIEGDNIPEFNSQGQVIATDAASTLVKDLTLYLEAAAEQNVFVILVLWNGATAIKDNLKGLMMDTSKLQTFIDNALVPMVHGLKNQTALIGYEIINEPCGSILSGNNGGTQCTDTRSLSGSGAGWTGSQIPMKNMQQFINLQTSAIKQTDPKTLVTVGIWNEKAGTDAFGYFNYFSNACLAAAGGKSDGIVDFQQLHTYAFNGAYDTHSPVNQNANDFGFDVPLVIGEYENQLNQWQYPQLYTHFYNGGYNGGWAWSMIGDNNEYQQIDAGTKTLDGKNGINVHITGGAHVSARCWCSDVPPAGDYTCAQQSGWGKCNETWMQGLCCQSCKACVGCT